MIGHALCVWLCPVSVTWLLPELWLGTDAYGMFQCLFAVLFWDSGFLKAVLYDLWVGGGGCL